MAERLSVRIFPRVVTISKIIPSGCRFEISSDMESFRIESYGNEEEFTTMLIQEIRAGDIVFDIGACVGLVSVHAAKKDVMVYSFEPDPYYRSRLTNNMRLNGLDNVNVIEWAVSDHAGQATLFTDGENGNSPSLRKIGERGSVMVKTDSIDKAIHRGDIPIPSVIKLDIEGAEILALRGMQELLIANHSPRAIFMEVHPDFLRYFGSSEKEIEDMMFQCGYTLDYKIDRSNQFHCVYRK
ncbi:MAG: FkbM family methyltransferase [Pseudomonadota bacterium]